MNRKFCISYKKDDKRFCDEVFAKNEAEADAIGKLLHGDTCTVDGQLLAEIPTNDTDAKYYDDDGNEISEEEWNIT